MWLRAAVSVTAVRKQRRRPETGKHGWCPLWVREAKTSNKMVNSSLKVRESQSSSLLGKGPRPGQLLETEVTKGMRRQRRKAWDTTKSLEGYVDLIKNGSYV